MRSESMLGLQKNHTAKRRFRDHVIFHLPHYIFHLSSREVRLRGPQMKDVMLQMENRRRLSLNIFPSLLTRQQRWSGAGERFAFPRRRRLRFRAFYDAFDSATILDGAAGVLSMYPTPRTVWISLGSY